MNRLIVIAAITVGVIELIKWLLFRNGDKVPFLHSYMFTGSMGSGKTYLATDQAIKIINRRSFWHRVYNVLPFIAWFFPSVAVEPKIYSTYPIVKYYRKVTEAEKKQFKEARKKEKKRLKKMKFKEVYELRIGGYRLPKVLKKIPVFYPPLLHEHLIGQKKCEEGSIWVISEAGRFLPQWDFNNPVICEQIAQTASFSRHFFNGVIIIDDQCSDNLVKAVRCRLGMIYHLHNFRRFGILPYYKVNYVPLLPVEDNNTTLESDGDSWFYGKLPYRWQRYKKRYESRCYKMLYTKKAEKYIAQFDGFYTTYMMNVAVNQSMMKLYKENKRRYKEMFLYDKDIRFDVDSGEFVDVKDVACENDRERKEDAAA